MIISEMPSTIIYSYTKEGGYTCLNIPKRFVKECSIVSGQRFLGFVRKGKFVIEQEVENGDAQLGPSSAKAK